jgi:hypothetical protein
MVKVKKIKKVKIKSKKFKKKFFKTNFFYIKFLSKNLKNNILKKNSKNFKLKLISGFKKKSFFLKKKIYKLSFFKNYLNKKFINKFTIRIQKNNFFFTFLRISKNKKGNLFTKVLLADSSGSYKIKMSKRNIRYKLKFVLKTFCKRVRKIRLIKNKKLKRTIFNSIFLKVVAPKRIRKKIFRHFKIYQKNKKGLSTFLLEPKKCFNGCRAIKMQRKRRLRFRIFK